MHWKKIALNILDDGDDLHDDHHNKVFDFNLIPLSWAKLSGFELFGDKWYWCNNIYTDWITCIDSSFALFLFQRSMHDYQITTMKQGQHKWRQTNSSWKHERWIKKTEHTPTKSYARPTDRTVKCCSPISLKFCGIFDLISIFFFITFDVMTNSCPARHPHWPMYVMDLCVCVYSAIFVCSNCCC